ncbi:uncharacterized protein N7515_006735 [Penicillium bovifimosum]|uniref:Fatty acid hydroxylase domain-containing protein n=1 Tax=Penicillium bovifimosum TaxID=126998 RepID=A0A9W9GVH4_9EURO|nr:uncharacterized protein N7515_006735 [Penicillium bovifimosum]KAJ5130696.1 hypothetical protein N7515_006735 [Penicillium bovifimosum]
MAAPMRNPKDSMTSTWRTGDRSAWTVGHWLLEFLNVHHVELDQEVPIHQKTDKVPYAPELQFHLWIIIHASIPLIIHQLYITIFGPPPTFLVYIFYSQALEFIAVHETHVLRRMGHTIGFFDGDKHARDGVPDVGVKKTVGSLLAVFILRPMYTVFFAYRRDEGPTSIRWGWLVFETGMYAVVLDFWYYLMHRSAHETDLLWKFHRTHHLTKHPNPLLTAYADRVQEFFDLVGAPLLTYGTLKLMGFPMGFYEWWICQQYVVFTEVLGHSGLRMIATAQNPWTWLLTLCDMELVIEDHDLHHRKGWKNSHNYGKQTRVWDRLFNTDIPRLEGHQGNIDYVNTAKLPLF